MKKSGFTLAELLIALAILGVIATFTIPKVLQSQQNGSYNAEAKEAVAAISGAFQAYQLNNAVTSGFTPTSLSPYLNYVRLETSLTIDDHYGNTTKDCTSTDPCVILHNGGALRLGSNSFAGTAGTNMVWLYFDPDAKVTDGTTNGPGKSVTFNLYYNGQITSRANAKPASYSSSGGPYGPNATFDPPWFSW